MNNTFTRMCTHKPCIEDAVGRAQEAGNMTSAGRVSKKRNIHRPRNRAEIHKSDHVIPLSELVCCLSPSLVLTCACLHIGTEEKQFFDLGLAKQIKETSG